jgi:hypothetical protein
MDALFICAQHAWLVSQSPVFHHHHALQLWADYTSAHHHLSDDLYSAAVTPTSKARRKWAQFLLNFEMTAS